MQTHGTTASTELASASQAPPILYQWKKVGDDDKDNFPDTSKGSLERVRQKLSIQMTEGMANYILSSEGKESIRKKLQSKAAKKIDWDTGIFTDGESKVRGKAKEWVRAVWPIYEEAAIKKLEELSRTPPPGNGDQPSNGGRPGNGGQPGSGSSPPARRGASMGGSGSTLLYLTLGLGVLGAGGYAVYEQMDED
jgi:hypothetical protein